MNTAVEVHAPLRKLIRITPLCQRLGGITTRTVYRWIQAGTFPPPIKLARRVAMWDESEVEAWIEKKRA